MSLAAVEAEQRVIAAAREEMIYRGGRTITRQDVRTAGERLGLQDAAARIGQRR